MGDPYGAHREVGLPSYPVGKTLITFVMERDPIWQRRRTPDPYGSYTEVVITRLVTSNDICNGKGSDLAKMWDPHSAYTEVVITRLVPSNNNC